MYTEGHRSEQKRLTTNIYLHLLVRFRTRIFLAGQVVQPSPFNLVVPGPGEWRLRVLGTVAIFSLRFVTNICPTGLRNRLRLRYNFSFSDPTASARFIWFIGERTLTRDRPQL